MEANDLEAEVSIDLGTKTYALKYKVRALRQLERATGKSVLKILSDVRADKSSVSAGFIFDAVLAGLAHLGREDFDEEWLERHFDTTKIPIYARAVFTGLALSVFGPEALRAVVVAPEEVASAPRPLGEISPGASG
jgi:hypothetical protein